MQLPMDCKYHHVVLKKKIKKNTEKTICSQNIKLGVIDILKYVKTNNL